ncbi:ATP-binding cassette domain-containing protein [Nocardia farcinica]|uniref:ATP-binding cassette domain-containing protein n=1 Tax=Nocardia farcinica TaxID=37329 RepID=UPI00245751A3|nr:ATP-binding cassette domain-containing protein [Nocardia farcinica]
MQNPDPAIEISRLRKNYRGADAGTGLNGIDLTVAAGTVCALLGPNGAGKTTAVRILATLLRPDAGTARVAGYDVVRDPVRVRERIGLVGQNAAVDEILSGRQNLVMFGRLNGLGPRAAARRAAELLDRFDLAAAEKRPVGDYSGGMRRRLDLAAALIVTPPVLFVDEPTTGLDPAARLQVWAAVTELVAAGTTVLLTTQYLEEADRLADHITLLDQGRVIAAGTPTELKSRVGSDWVETTFDDTSAAEHAAELARPLACGEVTTDPATHTVRIPVLDRAEGVLALADVLRRADLAPRDLDVRTPSLDEVFLHLTRHGKDSQ